MIRKSAFLPSSLAEWLRQFCHYLRKEGYTVGPEKWLVGLKVLEKSDLANYQHVRMALRLVLCSNKVEYEKFNILFQKWFEEKGSIPIGQSSKINEEPSEMMNSSHSQEGVQVHDQGEEEVVDGDAKVEGSNSGSASSDKSIYKQLIEEKEMERATKSLIKKIKNKSSRKFKRMKKGHLLDFRYLMRKGSSRGFLYESLLWKGPVKRKEDIIFLWDGSQSMASYSDPLFQFAFSLTKMSKHAEVFLFSTKIKRMTKQLKNGKPLSSIRLALKGDSWGGGTRIGECLQTFLKEYAPIYCSKNTVLIIASDGCETGDSELLGRVMQQIKESSAKIIWLNPLLSLPNYKPEAKGMQAALPYIDYFHEIKDFQSINRLSQEFRSHQ